jgi:hypothetical protein
MVPNEAIDDCEKTQKAADGNRQKTAMEHFDDTGLMALVCHHDIPLFFANIDTPGEQQKYAIALVNHLFSLLPSQATVYLLYDVGCVLDRSLHLACDISGTSAYANISSQYDILPNSTISRLGFATSAIHAYAHQLSCQLAFNPRLHPGLRLTDGEGVERLWSRMRKLIGVTRKSGVSLSGRTYSDALKQC